MNDENAIEDQLRSLLREIQSRHKGDEAEHALRQREIDKARAALGMLVASQGGQSVALEAGRLAIGRLAALVESRANQVISLNGPSCVVGASRAELGREIAEAMKRAPRSTEGGALASSESVGSNRAAEPVPLEPEHALRARLVRAAADLALDREPEAARACLDVATFIQLNGI